MRKIVKNVLIASTALSLSACESIQDAASGVNMPGTTTTKPALTNSDVISGLKEALTVGIQNSVNLSSVTDGFWKNDLIRIPFPEDALKVKQKAIDWGLGAKVEQFETTLNRAAEDATKEALPIFKNAIMNMSISDGFSILNGGDGAATRFLKTQTTEQLVAAFSPKVSASISKVKLTEYWNPIITKYNSAMSLTGGQKLNPDLNQYVTERAISGLFLLVEQEENKIRKDPAARVNAILQKVFGSIGAK